MTVREDEQRLTLTAVVDLFEIDATAAGGAVHRFVTGPWNGADVVYGGVAYSASPIELDGVDYAGEGPAPRPALKMSRLDAHVAAAVVGAENWRGAKLTRIRTMTRYLDGEADADPMRHWPAEIWIVERLASTSKSEVAWQLASPLDLDGRRLPGRQIVRNVCNWRYRARRAGAWVYTHAECPYTGDRYFDAQDNPVTDPDDDACSRRVSGCQLRFPGALPFGGFPGVGRVRR